MNRLVSVLALGAALATALPAAAQEKVQVAPDLATLEALCEVNAADEDAERLCLYVVHEIMLSAPDHEPEGADLQTIEEPEPVVYGLGDAQDRDGVRIKPIKVDWSVPPLTSFDVPGKGLKYVGVLVQYRAGEEGASYDDGDWAVRDRKGFSYDRLVVSQARPALLSGDIEPDRTVRGWMTFEVPRNTRWLEVRQERLGVLDPLYWTVRDKKRK